MKVTLTYHTITCMLVCISFLFLCFYFTYIYKIVILQFYILSYIQVYCEHFYVIMKAMILV